MGFSDTQDTSLQGDDFLFHSDEEIVFLASLHQEVFAIDKHVGRDDGVGGH